MKPKFEFNVNKETKTIHMTREFAADADLVWDAFTKADMLEQWIAPKPCVAKTKEMDFRVGGRFVYSMVCPGREGYSKQEFITIEPKTRSSTKNTFSDENGNSLGTGFSIVHNTFEAGEGITTVYIEKVFDDMATLEMIATSGFIQGSAA